MINSLAPRGSANVISSQSIVCLWGVGASAVELAPCYKVTQLACEANASRIFNPTGSL